MSSLFSFLVSFLVRPVCRFLVGLRFGPALCGTAVEDGRKPPAQPAPSVLEGGATTTPPCGPAGRSTLLCGIVLSLCPFEPAPVAGVSLLSGVGARPPPYGV